MDAENQKILMMIIRQSLETAAKMLDIAILSTPTGKERNQLTEANVHLLAAKLLLRV